jgi:hypothetical protein
MMVDTPIEKSCCESDPALGLAGWDGCSDRSIDALAPLPGPSIEAPGLVVVASRTHATAADSVALPSGPRFVPKPSKTVLLI